MIMKTCLTASLCVLTATMNAYAGHSCSCAGKLNTENLYVGLSVGKITAEETIDFAGDDFKIYAGFQISPKIAIEAQYTKLDETNPVVLATGQGGAGNLEVSSLGIAAKINLTNNKRARPFIKIGVNKIDAKFKFAGTKIAEDDDTKLLLGIGFESKFTNNISLRGEYERFDNDFGMVSLGITRNFY